MKKNDAEIPRVFVLKKKSDAVAFRALRKSNPHIHIIDDLVEEQTELRLVEKPTRLFAAPPLKKTIMRDTDGVWAYIPWRRTLVHILPARQFNRLRTSRNAHLIVQKEQKIFEASRIGIAGLNVGNPAAVCLALEGVARMKFADNDILSLSNLNRFRAGICDLGINKAILTARQVYEINPFAQLEVLPGGIQPDNLDSFVTGIDVLIEEMDHLGLKLAIRRAARKKRVPVVMVTGNGSNIILDVERYDTTPRLPLLNGLIDTNVVKTIETTRGPLPLPEKIRLARDFMGAHELTKRLRLSFGEMGKSIVGIPQLAEASFLRGAVLTFVIRQIVLGERMPSGRYHISLDEVVK